MFINVHIYDVSDMYIVPRHRMLLNLAEVSKKEYLDFRRLVGAQLLNAMPLDLRMSLLPCCKRFFFFLHSQKCMYVYSHGMCYVFLQLRSHYSLSLLCM